MKKTFNFVAVALSATILFSSCIGSFALTNKLKDWNESIGNKAVNELVFICLNIVPAYQIALFVDAVVFNSAEFWTGKNLISKKAGETKVVKNANGEDVTITAQENGYNFSNGDTAINLVYDDADQSWSVEYNNQSTKLIKFIDDNNAELFLLNGETMNVTLDDNGVNVARQMLMGNCYAMSK